MSKGSQMSATHRQLITELHLEGNGPTAIHEELTRRAARHNQGRRADAPEWEHVPSLRTVQRFVQHDLTAKDDSGPWMFADAASEDAALVLDVAGRMFLLASGRDWPSKHRAEEIVRIRTAVPDVPLDWAWQLAGAYQLRRDKGRDSRHLDVVLGIRPWVNPNDGKRIYAALLANDPHINGVEHTNRISTWTGDADDLSRLLTMTVSYAGSFTTFCKHMLYTDPAGAIVAAGRRMIAEQQDDLLYAVQADRLEHGNFDGDFE